MKLVADGGHSSSDNTKLPCATFSLLALYQQDGLLDPRYVDLESQMGIPPALVSSSNQIQLATTHQHVSVFSTTVISVSHKNANSMYTNQQDAQNSCD